MIEYKEEDGLLPLLFRREGSVAYRALMFSLPSTVLAILIGYLEEESPGFTEVHLFSNLSGSHIWNAATGVCLILLAFRTRMAFDRFWEGTGLLHMMRGEWFDTVSNCFSFSIAAKKTKPEMVGRFRHSLIRLMSLCHGSSLEEIAGGDVKMEVIDMEGLDKSTLMHLQECDQVYGFNKVEVMLHLVQSLITQAHHDGVLTIAPPILTRVYQTISRGFVNLLNAKKITDTKFPFPYVQLIAGLLFLDGILTPIMIGQVVKSKILAGFLTFIPIFGMSAINFIACELELPFGSDANDLPLEHFQEELNSCLLMLLHDDTDMIAGTSPICMRNFTQLLEAMAKPDDDEDCMRNKRLENFYGEGGAARLKALQEGEPNEESLVTATPPLTPAAPIEPLQLPVVPEPLVVEPPSPPLSPEEIERLREEESMRLEAAQREVEKRMNEFYLALQRWTLMIEGQVKQIHDILDVLRLLSEAAGKSPEGWEQAFHPI